MVARKRCVVEINKREVNFDTFAIREGDAKHARNTCKNVTIVKAGENVELNFFKGIFPDAPDQHAEMALETRLVMLCEAWSICQKSR